MLFNLKSYGRLSLVCLMLSVFSYATFAQGAYPHTGAEVFEGVYFKDGPVAQKIDILRNNSFRNHIKDRNQLKAADHFQDQVMKRVASENPQFFNKFGAQIATRNHIKVMTALEDAGEVFYGTIVDMMYENTNNAQTQDKEEELAYLRKYLNGYATSYQGANKKTSPGSEEVSPGETNLIAIVWLAVVAWEYAWVSEEFIIDEKRMDVGGGLKKEQLVKALVNLK
ncbi:MAG: hypothetical protein AAFO82_14300 [Bacteroidota bacterium]